MKKHNFSIVIEKDKHGYFASCPELQGCYVQGKSYEETVKNIRDVIKLHVADRQAHREKFLPRDYFVSLSSVEVAV